MVLSSVPDSFPFWLVGRSGRKWRGRELKVQRKLLLRESGQRRCVSFMRSAYKREGCEGTHDNTVFPGENGKLIEASNEIPTGSDVASDEDAEREDRKGVHRSAIPRGSTCRPLVKA